MKKLKENCRELLGILTKNPTYHEALHHIYALSERVRRSFFKSQTIFILPFFISLMKSHESTHSLIYIKLESG
jgi:hypothetical protein